MGTTVNTTGTGHAVISAEELARMLVESSTRKAPVAAKQGRRAEEDAITDTSVEQAALPVKDEGEALDEAPRKEASTEGEPSDSRGDVASQGGDGGVAAASGELIELAQAPSGAAAPVKPAVVATADDGAGAGIPLLFLGGGAALGIAALDDGGGGGGTPPAPARPNVTPPPPPPPASVESFADFNEQAGDEAPEPITVKEDKNEVLLITDGFDREDALPDTLANLQEEHLRYDLNGKDDKVDFRGLEANLKDDADVLLAAVAVASGDKSPYNGELLSDDDMPAEVAMLSESTSYGSEVPSSDVIWVANLGAVGDGATDDATAIVAGVAIAVDGGDAEVGISNLYVDLAGEGEVTAAGAIVALASGEGPSTYGPDDEVIPGEPSQAAALVGNDLRVSATADDEADEDEPGDDKESDVAASSEETRPGEANAVGLVVALADDAATATASVGGDVSVSASGHDANALGVVAAAADEGATATASVGGELSVSAEGVDSAVAVAVVVAGAPGITQDEPEQVASGDVSIGSVSVSAGTTGESGEADASLLLAVAGAYGEGSTANVDIGDVSVSAEGSEANASVGIVAAGADGDGSTADVMTGDIMVTSEAGDSATAAVGAIVAQAGDGYSTEDVQNASASVGDVSVNATAGDEAMASVGAISAGAIGGMVTETEDGEEVASSTANVDVGGVSVQANSDTCDASATLLAINAGAASLGSAGVSVGAVEVSAAGEDSANAQLGLISASATYDASASVSVDSVLVEATATPDDDEDEDSDADAHAIVGSISAQAGSGSEAMVAVGDIDVSASGDSATAGVGSIAAAASGHSNAGVAVGAVDVTADAGDGNATAFVQAISANGTAGGDASVSADAVSVSATATGDASARAAISANASTGGTGAVSIGGDVDVTAAGVLAAAIGSVNASGSGVVDVGGDLNVSADGSNRSLAVGTIATSGTSSVTAGNLGVSATAGSNLATADGSVSASGDSSATVASLTASAEGKDAVATGTVLAEGGSATVEGAVDVSAAGERNGVAHGLVAAGGEGVAEAGDVSVTATAASQAVASGTLNSLGASVTAGDLTVSATSGAGLLQTANAIASATTTGGSVSAGDVTVSAEGNVATAVAFLIANNGSVDVGDATATAEGNTASAVAVVAAGNTGEVDFDSLAVTATATGGSTAVGQITAADDSSVTGGNVSVSADGDSANATLIVIASDDSVVDIGNLALSVTASEEGNAHGTVAASDESTVLVGSASLDVQGDGSYGQLEIFATDSASSVVVGDINVSVGADASADVEVQFADSPYDYRNGEVFIGDVDAGVADGGHLSIQIGDLAGDAATDAKRSASFDGEGEVDMELNDQVFGMIDVSDLDGQFDLVMHLDETDPGTVPNTTILGYDRETDTIEINGDDLELGNVTDIGQFSDEGELFTQLEVALEGGYGDDYAFAVYTGDDITGDGKAEVGLGVLAYDDDGDGLTSVLYLEGVDTFGELVFVPSPPPPPPLPETGPV